jgi:anti-sigma regulatory factor (Ser/Thr protein kinase)
MSCATLPNRRCADAGLDRAVEKRRLFVLNNSGSAVHSFVRFVEAELSRRDSCDESSRMQIELALSEALANALYHGNLEMSSHLRECDDAKFYGLAERRRRQSPYCNRRIHVKLSITNDRAEIAIRDEGRGFDPTAVPDPCESTNIDRVSGRGILLMRGLMDRVMFNQRGNEVRMVKCWNQRS